MIKNWLVRGDCHGKFDWLMRLDTEKYKPEETAIIILGDAGLNFYLNKTDERTKQFVENMRYFLYCVHGNHEARPSTIDGIWLHYDENVKGEVWYQPEYPHISYFKMYGEYVINGIETAVIGGAYSVDKWYRLLRAGLTEETNNPKHSFWFSDEQLTEEERKECDTLAWNTTADILLSHTCPTEFQPIDLFLSGIDQSKVDSSMEELLTYFIRRSRIQYIAFGHYHDDRVMDMEFTDADIDDWEVYNPYFNVHGTMLFNHIVEFKDLLNNNYQMGGKNDGY